ncbi:hypothetical protein BDP27DRAFT_208978 [Rhodocollybia butyracea]|uniref:Secreted protein n=1 Tax=Rhodocollybia butyracea TaxID=206335 RepID=A0A9P5PE13_9AGAR|nr:hypothetical protein BDP27DRAFT_208978 [Rhodocollybia butyracea]
MEPACWYKISLHSLHSLCLLLDLCIRTSVTAVGTITKVPECRRDLLVEWLALSKCYEFGISACEKGNNVNSRNGYEAYQSVPQVRFGYDYAGRSFKMLFPTIISSPGKNQQ